MYDRILVPTDGSEAAESAIDRAVDLAAEYDATLHVLSVVDTATYASAEFDVGTVREAMGSEAETAVERLAGVARDAGLRVETAVVHGSPARSIVEYVEDNDVDLVVMSTHGRRGVSRYLLGSVAERVVRTSPVPVLTVHADEEGSDEAGQGA